MPDRFAPFAMRMHSYRCRCHLDSFISSLFVNHNQCNNCNTHHAIIHDVSAACKNNNATCLHPRTTISLGFFVAIFSFCFCFVQTVCRHCAHIMQQSCFRCVAHTATAQHNSHTHIRTHKNCPHKSNILHDRARTSLCANCMYLWRPLTNVVYLRFRLKRPHSMCVY